MNINRQNKIRHERVFIAALISFGIVFVYIRLICFGNEPQTYTDIVIEFTSMDDSNKSTERTLVWILSLIGAAASFVFYSVWNRPHENSLRTSAGEKGDETPVSTPLGIIGNAIKRHFPAAASGKIILTVILAVSVTHLLVYTGKSPTLTMYFLFCITAVAVNRERLLSGTVFLTYSLYALCGLYRLTVLFGCDERLRLIYTAAIPLALAIALLLLSQYRKKDYFVKGILAAQTVIPFSLLLFLSSRYLYRGVMTEIHVPARISLLIWLVIAVFAVQAVRKITKHWRGNAGINDVITFGTICCIMNYNRYSGSGVIMPDDPHHPFENIIAYSQTVELGQKLFSEYIPVSGLFSFVQGFFLSFFGKGEYANYNVTENLFYFAVICATVFLLMKHVRPTTALLTAMVVPIILYNRVALIIPIMLLLMLPGLIEKRSLWMQVWFLTSLVHGLYYPVFGAAVCVGYLPMGIYQMAAYIREKRIKEDIKKPAFWIGWGFCLLSSVLAVPLLAGTFRHMTAMSDQTVYADGISRFGQSIDPFFFRYIDSVGLRLLAYNVLTFLLPAAAVWISAILACRAGGVVLKGRRMTVEKPVALSVCCSFGIALMISFSYTLIRFDINYLSDRRGGIYARSSEMIFASALMMFVICEKYVKNTARKCILIGTAVFLVAVTSGESLLGVDDATKLMPCYSVSDSYVLSEGDKVPKLGRCFVQEKLYRRILEKYDDARSAHPDDSFFGMGHFGTYYLCEVPGDSVLESATVKGFGAAQETADILRRNKTVVTGIDPYATGIDSSLLYYLYHWLVTSGEYVWSAEDGRFYPNSHHIPREQFLAQNRNIAIPEESVPMGRTASSWGASMASLEGIFTRSDVSCAAEYKDRRLIVDFSEEIDGDEADFIYMDFKIGDTFSCILFDHYEDEVYENTTWFDRTLLKKDYNRGMTVTVSWKDDAGHTYDINCSMGRGKLLIPLGSGRGWLLHPHSELSVEAARDGRRVEVPEINEIRLLKCREVS